MRERCLELTQELETVKERAEKAEARFKKLESEIGDMIKYCWTQEYAGAHYTCVYCSSMEKDGHYPHCQILRLNKLMEASNDE